MRASRCALLTLALCLGSAIGDSPDCSADNGDACRGTPSEVTDDASLIQLRKGGEQSKGDLNATIALGQQRVRKPNIVYILADDLGFGDLQSYAGEDSIIDTPAIDRLAEGGMRLNRYYAQPTCSPTRAAIHTGRYPIRYGLQMLVITKTAPYSLPLDEPMLPQAFQAAGYSTHAVGKWHLGFNTWNATPTFRGYDTWTGYYHGEVDPFTQIRSINGSDFYDWHVQDRPQCGKDCMQTDLSAKGIYNTYTITKEAVRIISEHDSDSEPMFMYVAYENVHAPCDVPEQYVEPYKSKVQDRTRQVYAGMVAAMDEGIGNITAALEAKGLLDDTIIIFSSDNGGPVGTPENLLGTVINTVREYAGISMKMCGNGSWAQDTGATNYPLRGSKGSLYEGGVRVPGIIHYPRAIRANSVFDGLFHVSDWFPTLLTAAGVPDVAQRPSFPFDGVDQWRALTDDTSGSLQDRMLLINTDWAQLGGAMVQGRYKYYFGGPFYFEIWQFPPEVGAAKGWAESADPQSLGSGKAIWCPLGCMVDLLEDPRETAPFTPSARTNQTLFRQLLNVSKAYYKLKGEAVTPLFWDTIFKPTTDLAIATAEANGDVWTPFMEA